jgi:MEDS: MEthanogen/methylotroph, DcmR Sensory domain
MMRFAPIEQAARNPAGVIPLWRDFVDENPGRPVRGISELAWPERTRAEMEECHRHEALLNLAFSGGRSWSLLCPYDACSLRDDELERAATTHELISREGRTERSAAFDTDPDCLSGELPPPRVRPEALSFGIAELSEVRRRVIGAAVA